MPENKLDGLRKKDPKELTPDEMESLARENSRMPQNPSDEADLKAKRETFRKLHDFLNEADIYEAEGQLGVIVGSLDKKMQDLAAKVQVGDCTFADADEKFLKAMEILKGATLTEAATYAEAMTHAIQQHRYLKTKDWKVKDMDIKLL